MPFHPEILACFAILSQVGCITSQLTFPRSPRKLTAENPDLALIKALAQVAQPGPTLQACICGMSLVSSRLQPLRDRLCLGHDGGGCRSLALVHVLTGMLRLCKPVPSSGASAAVLGQTICLETKVQMLQSLQIVFEKD